MYRAIVADDEDIIVNGMSKYIQSLNLGIKVVATSNDGRDTLEKFHKYCPDILLIDINMPHLTGLDCVKEIRKLNSTTVIIIISGYDKFEYTKQAIQNNVDFYLLKPIDDDEFLDVMKEAINIFNDRLAKQNILSKYNLNNNDIEGNVIDYINSHYTQSTLSTDLLESKFNMNRISLYKLVKKATNMSFIEYVTTLRINHAIRLLNSNKNLSIGEIAIEVGYSDQYYFSRVFKKSTGYSPKDYKNKSKEGVS